MLRRAEQLMMLPDLRRAFAVYGTAPLLSAAALGCTPLEDGADFFAKPAQGGQDGTGGHGGQGGEGGAGGQQPLPCPPIDQREVVELPDPDTDATEIEITESTRWDCFHDYVIRDDATVVVTNDAVLTVDPGVRMRAGNDSLLLVTRGSRLDAVGTRDEPIVFTSLDSAGVGRSRGDWRGIVLAGRAPAHETTEEVSIAGGDRRARYGGDDETWNCGQLRYLRVEFAGASVGEIYDEPNAALNLAGCGTLTLVDHVQVHASIDGVGLWGGSVNLTRVLVSSTVQGDSIEWRAGYRGTMQFVVAQNVLGATGMKGSNDDPNRSRVPVSRPIIFNATLVGRPASADPLFHRGLVLQFGSSVEMRNSIIASFRSYGLDVESLESAALAGAAENELIVSHTILHENGLGLPDGGIEVDGNIDDDGGFDEQAYFSQSELLNRDTSINPFEGDPASIEAPDFSTNEQAETAPYEGPFPSGIEAVGYRGAIEPFGVDWTAGWTAYPVE